MLEHYDLFMGVLAIVLAFAAYLGYYSKGYASEIDRDGKILRVCEAVHDLLAPIALATPTKVDDAIDAAILAVVKILKDKDKIEVLSDEEKTTIKEFFTSRIK